MIRVDKNQVKVGGCRRTLKAKFLKACATPGLFSNLLPALTKKVTAEVGWPLSMAATLTPLAESTMVAKERARRVELRTVVVDARNIWWAREREKESMDREVVNGNRRVLVGGRLCPQSLKTHPSVPALSDRRTRAKR